MKTRLGHAPEAALVPRYTLGENTQHAVVVVGSALEVVKIVDFL